MDVTITTNPTRSLTQMSPALLWVSIGIDHDTVCAGVVGTAIRHFRIAVPTTQAQTVYVANLYSTTITILQKSKGNLRIRRLVPLFVPIGVCVTTHDDGAASDVTIGMWRHNQQATNHERNGKPCLFTPQICKWWYAVEWMIYENMYKWCHESKRNYTLVNLKATKIS